MTATVGRSPEAPCVALESPGRRELIDTPSSRSFPAGAGCRIVLGVHRSIRPPAAAWVTASALSPK